ncbi:MAG: bifunctional lysine ketoglutarate reductase /saccharopine dehydrogenase family protein [Candidatus Delongbacteria bacterium]|jgi:alpha-aminoadipic semialdehyde synthase|nr:bifunctional lysine ketoglutarate reductase /saccharopine dehydrogenase family protein [Candidatus Delongbacteria bacterium]
MAATIGIRHEDKYELERRVPLVPEDVKKLTDTDLKIIVQKCGKRIFKDGEYEAAGAVLADSMNDADVIFGVKEVTIPSFVEKKTYVFFSHIIKGQKYNMPMLRTMIEKKVNLIDYEKVADDKNRRLIFFGNFAGLAGMINSIWSAGLRYEYLGINTPFLKLKQARMYNSLLEAKEVLKDISKDIGQNGLPEELCPFVVGFTGYGNVSKGAQEILDILPHEEITPEELHGLKNTAYSTKKIYKVIFKEEHLSEHKENKPFELQHYYKNPGEYRSIFEQYIPEMSILMNCMYWSPEYPRIVTKDYLEKNYTEDFKLKVIGDVTCDVNGSVECTEMGTHIDDPIFVYDTKKQTFQMGYKGRGLLMMTVDILPSELPRESSQFFSGALYPFVKSIAECDFNKPFAEIDLPAEIKKALILLKGEFTPDYKYIQNYIK